MKSLKEMIQAEHSKAQMLRIVDWVGHDKKRFNELLRCFISSDALISQRAGYPLSHIAIAHPDFVMPHLEKLITFSLQPGLHNAIRRHTTRILEQITVPNKLKGKVMSMCFDFIVDPDEKVAIKAFSLGILENMLKEYPEIGAELKVIIEDQYLRQTPAFHYRAKRILKKI